MTLRPSVLEYGTVRPRRPTSTLLFRVIYATVILFAVYSLLKAVAAIWLSDPQLRTVVVETQPMPARLAWAVEESPWSSGVRLLAAGVALSLCMLRVSFMEKHPSIALTAGLLASAYFLLEIAAAVARVWYSPFLCRTGSNPPHEAVIIVNGTYFLEIGLSIIPLACLLSLMWMSRGRDAASDKTQVAKPMDHEA